MGSCQPGKALISHGYIYYLGSRRRVQVNFTPELRDKTLSTIARAFSVAALFKAPLYPLCANCVERVETVGGPPPVEELLFVV